RTGVPPCYAASPPPQDLSSTCGGLGSWCRWVTHPKIAAPAVATGGQSGKRHGLHRDQRRRIASAGCPHPCDPRIARKPGLGGAAPWPSLPPVVLATSLPGAGARRSRAHVRPPALIEPVARHCTARAIGCCRRGQNDRG